MRRLLLVAALAAGGVALSAGGAAAQHAGGQQRHWGPHATSVTWPSVTPPGWYTNTYNHAWYYPWYAYYNHTSGPYANWMAGGGYATYAHHGPAGMYYSHKEPTQPYFGEGRDWPFKGATNSPTAFQTLQGNIVPKPPEPMPEKK